MTRRSAPCPNCGAPIEFLWSSAVQTTCSFCRSILVRQTYVFDRMPFKVTTLTQARYRGVEGELPFEYWDKHEVLFADLQSEGERFATIDYSDGETSPSLYIGEYFEFDELSLSNLR